MMTAAARSSLFLAVALVGAVWPTCRGVEAASARPVQIGVLTTSFGLPPHAAGLRDGLRALGHRDEKDFLLGVRFTAGDMATLAAAARDLIEAGADIIFAAGANPALAARQASERVPIVFAAVGDPVGLQLVESFARPGGNVTGVADRDIELGPKRLELFKAIVPELRRVLYLYDGDDPYSVTLARTYREAARRLDLVLVERAVRSKREAKGILAALRPGEVHGAVTPTHASLNIPGLLLQAAERHRLPLMGTTAVAVEAGALASYGSDLYDSGRQAARLVDKILKGTNPADIPVETNARIELSINKRTAKALGRTLTPEILLRADRIVR